MRYIFIWSSVIFFFAVCNGQNNKTSPQNKPYYKNQIELRHDNDFLIFTDRYYTTGSYIEYRKLLENEPNNTRKVQRLLRLDHLFYTPTNIISSEIKDFDRPYVGYLGISGGSKISYETQAFHFRMAIGVTGPMSFAEGFQNLFHSSGGISTPPWSSQIKNNFHFNVYGGYVKEWMLNPNPFSVYASFTPEIAIGTRDIFIDHGLKVYFGKRNSLTHSMAYSQLGEVEKEFFFTINFTYRNVIHNALLEGHLVGDDSPFLLNATRELYLYGITGYFRTNRNDLKIGYQYSTKETVNTQFHMYITLAIARRF